MFYSRFCFHSEVYSQCKNKKKDEAANFVVNNFPHPGTGKQFFFFAK